MTRGPHRKLRASYGARERPDTVKFPEQIPADRCHYYFATKKRAGAGHPGAICKIGKRVDMDRVHSFYLIPKFLKSVQPFP